ncbi:GGDEF domain-containing protein [Aliidongia dinghuensis]|nr:sensor domain-containing diguanylate cyclase [Aliidongia dinghuensis]
MSQANIETVESLPHALTNLVGFGGAALVVEPSGEVRGANDLGIDLLANFDDDTVHEVAIAGARAIAAGALRLERLNGPFPGDCADVIIQPLVGRAAGALVLIATNPAESALRRALIESRQRYRDLVEAASEFVWETDRHGRFVFLSGSGAFGYATRDLLGRLATDFVVDASPLPYPVFQARDTVLQTDVWLQRADGTTSCQSITAVPIYDPDGQWCGTRGMGRDVTEQRERERAEKQRLLRDRLMTYLGDTIRTEINPEKTLPAALSGTGLAIGADGGMILAGHPAAASYDVVSWGEPLPEHDFPEAHAALVEQGAVDLLRGGLQLIGQLTEDASAGDGRINGAVLFWCKTESRGFGDGDRAVLSDVAAQIGLAIAQLKKFHEIVTISNTDSLTGVLNRRAFFADLERRLGRHMVAQTGGALVYLDINNLKALNDYAGHLAGDRAILTFAELTKAATRASDLIARIGGDEFLIWLDGVTAESAPVRAEALLLQMNRLEQLSVVPDRPLGVSIGMALYDGAAPVALDRLLAAADAAMYRVKARRKSGYEIAPRLLPDDTGPPEPLDAMAGMAGEPIRADGSVE